MKVIYKTSKAHTEKLMFDFFKQTSIPRMITKYQSEKTDQVKRVKAI